MGGLAIDTGLQSDYEDKHLVTRPVLMLLWQVVQVVLIVAGVVRKVIVPWFATRHRIPPPQLQHADLKRGAVQKGMQEVWRRVPTLRERIIQHYEASSTPLFSFSGEYRNKPLLLPCHSSLEQATYVGGLDSNGAPHGMGAWHDTHKDGELLIGQFMHGRPVPPCRVRITRSSFVCHQITLLSCRSDGMSRQGSLNGVWGKNAVNGGRQPVPLQVAVAGVECCSSGVFYQGYPRVEWLEEPTPVNIESQANAPGNRGNQDVGLHVVSDASKAPICIPATHACDQHATDKRNSAWTPQHLRQGSGLLTPAAPQLQHQNYTSWLECNAVGGTEGRYDVIFFVHGFNCGVEHCMSSLGQFLALGSLPEDIRPVIFGWPCTGGPFYPFGLSVTLSDYVSGKMIEALQHLQADGCRRVHMFGHSMGARVVASASDRFAELFQQTPHVDPLQPAETNATSGATMQLASVTFLSPDMDYGEFVGHCGPILRSLCSLVTIYGDSADSALDIAVTLNAYVFKAIPSVAPPGLKEETEKLGIPISASLGQHCNTCTDSKGNVLDVDYVATTVLSSNVHGMRHNYFHLNREMVDDIRDLMVTGKRASERPYRLEWTAQNTYGFIVAPNYLVA